MKIPLLAFQAALVRNRFVDHPKFFLAGFAIEDVDGAAKLAVRTGYKAALVHGLIIAQKAAV